MGDIGKIDKCSQLSSTTACSPLPVREGELLVDNDLDGFIQPEGLATRAPQDSEDKTVNLAFGDLPDFFEETLNCVNEALPMAQAAFIDISRRVDIRKAVDGRFSDLEEEGWRLYESTKETLLLTGLDQCRYLFQRLNSRKEFKKHEATLSNRQRRQFRESARNRRDILFDQTDKDVEDFLRGLRHYLLYDLGSALDDEVFGCTNSEESLPDEETCPSYLNEEVTECGGNTPSLPEFDPHLHASRTSRSRRSMRSTLIAKGGRNIRRHSSDRRESVVGKFRSIDPSKGSIPRIAKRDSMARSAKKRSAPDDEKNHMARTGGPQTSSESRRRRALQKRNYSTCASDADNESVPFETNEATTLAGPSLETLLETSSMRSQNLSAIQPQTERRVNSKIAAVDRMQAFLDANISHVESWFEPFLNNTTLAHPPHINQRKKREISSRFHVVDSPSYVNIDSSF